MALHGKGMIWHGRGNGMAWNGRGMLWHGRVGYDMIWVWYGMV